MRSLHLRIVASDPDREDIVDLTAELRRAGHTVLTSDSDRPPVGVAKAPDFVLTEGPGDPPTETLDAAEARHISAVLRYTNGNRRQTALILGVARSTLLAKIRKFGIST